MARARLVVIDPLTAFIDGDQVDTHKVSDVRKMLKHVAAIAESHRCAIVCVVHFHKGEVANIIHQISGSAGFGDAARSAFAVGTDPTWTGEDADAPLVFLHVKNNWGKKQPPLRFHVEDVVLKEHGGIETSRVVWDGEDRGIRVDHVFGRRRDSGPSGEREAAQQFYATSSRTAPFRPKTSMRQQGRPGRPGPSVALGYGVALRARTAPQKTHASMPFARAISLSSMASGSATLPAGS